MGWWSGNQAPPSSIELHNSSRISPCRRALTTSRECWSEEEDLRAAEHACSPAATRLAAGRRFKRALLKRVGAALLIAMAPLQVHAQNAACNAPRQRANAEQRRLSALAYVLSPPPATRGTMPNYLPTISPKDAQPIPPVAAATPPSRRAWRQAGRVRRSRGHQGRHRQGAQPHLAGLQRPPHAQHAGSCRQERSARCRRVHRHRLCPRRCGSGRPQWRRVSEQLRPKLPKLALVVDEADTGVFAYMTFPTQHRTKLHSTNPIKRLNGARC